MKSKDAGKVAAMVSVDEFFDSYDSWIIRIQSIW